MTQLTPPTLVKHHGPGLPVHSRRPKPTHRTTSRHPPESDSREASTANSNRSNGRAKAGRSSRAPAPASHDPVLHSVQVDAPSSICPSLVHLHPLLVTNPDPAVRPRTPLHLLHRPRRSRPAARHRRRVCRRDHHHHHHHIIISSSSSSRHDNCCSCHDQEDPPLGPQARRRVPRDQGAQAAGAGRDCAGEGSGACGSGVSQGREGGGGEWWWWG